MGGGKSSSTTQEVSLPKELEMGATGALGGAMQSAGLDYSPNRGVTIAGFSPQQEAAMQGSGMMAGALGLPTGQGSYLPEQQTTAEGFRGYSTGGLYDESVDASMSQNEQDRRSAILKNYGNIGNEIMQSKFGDGYYVSPTGDGSSEQPVSQSSAGKGPIMTAGGKEASPGGQAYVRMLGGDHSMFKGGK